MNSFIRWLMRLRGAEIDGEKSFSSIGRDEFEYREGSRRMIIYAELLVGEASRAIDASSIERWLPPHDAEIVNSKQKREILRDIVTFFERRGKRAIVQNRQTWCPDDT